MELLSFPFMQRALLIGAIVGTLTAFLGVFVTLRRMSFFADAISHSALAGIALGLLLSTDPFATAVAFCILVALGIAYMSERSVLALDTIIAVFFSASIALGILIIGFLVGFRTDLFSFLFGDILAITTTDIVLALLLGLLVALSFLAFFPQFLQISFNRDIALVDGVRVRYLDYVFMLILALVVAISLRIVGVLLVTALMIVPAAAARNVSRSFREMTVVSTVIGFVAAIVGLILAYALNTASGPTMTLTAVLIFALSFPVGKLRGAL